MALRTIMLKGRGIRDEALAAVAINPGYLLERVSGADTIQPHSTAAASAQKIFAVENELAGSEITVAYAIDDTVFFESAGPGQMVNALLPASAAAIVRGDFLESAGDGTLRLVAADAATDEAQRNALIAVAREDVDNSAGGTEVRIKVEVL